MNGLKADPKLGNMNGWQERHNAAVDAPKPGFERAIVGMTKAWVEYAEAVKRESDSLIGEDGVLGEEWRDIGRGIIGLLNGNTGARLDCGTLDTFIRKTLAAYGEESEW